MITLNQEEQELLIKNKDLFDKGKLDEFWYEVFWDATHEQMSDIIQFLRQYFTDEQLIDTIVPPYFFYYDNNPIWFDRVAKVYTDSYKRNSIIKGTSDISKLVYFEELPNFEYFILNDESLDELQGFILFNEFYNLDFSITDNKFSMTGEYVGQRGNSNIDFSGITDPDSLMNIYSDITYHTSMKINRCVFPDLLTVYLPKTENGGNPILAANELEFGKNTTDIKFSNVRSNMIKVKKFIVHNRKAYKIISDAIKYKHLNSTVELI